jgi:signal transduction histidine kinase
LKLSSAKIFRTATFRTAIMASAAFGLITLLLFGFIYWQTAGLETTRIDQFLLHESLAISRQRPDQVVADVNTRYARDLHRQSVAAVFTPARAWLGGALTTYPAGLEADGKPHSTTALRQETGGRQAETLRAVARVLPDGSLLVVGRSQDEVEKLRALVLRALLLGLLPALASALCVGAFASQRTIARVNDMNQTIGRIMQGRLHERLAAPGASGDALGQLTTAVNRMLDDIERLMEEIRGVGDDIAHDLRTPLARLRARLEGGLHRANSLDALRGVVSSAIADLDQAFTLITALLRIGQIEGSARQSGFGRVDLAAIAAEVCELYEPLAELNGIAFSLSADENLEVGGDRDLLLEAAANLVDNALKFTPRGGRVAVRAAATEAGPVLSVTDSGPGIAPHEQAAVLKRFYRSSRIAQVPGHGLGLSLVCAIVRLHMFHLRMADAGPGLTVEICCWPAGADAPAPPAARRTGAAQAGPAQAGAAVRQDALIGTDSSGS